VKKRKTGQIDQYLCFFGIPRNASTSIRATLNLEKNFVKDFKEYIKEKKKRQDEFFKFTVIREPISRFVSGFLELIKYKKLLQFSYFVDDNPIELKFVEFLDLVESGDIMDDHINHQTYFLNYKVDIDFIICYELIVRE